MVVNIWTKTFQYPLYTIPPPSYLILFILMFSIREGPLNSPLP